MCSFVSTVGFTKHQRHPNATSVGGCKVQYRRSCRRPRAVLQPPEDREVLEERLRTGSQAEQMQAMIALPRLPSAVSVPLIHSTGVLRSENLQVRLTAVATLGKLGMLSEGRTLLAVLRNDTDEDYSVRAAAANALGSLLEPPRPIGAELLVRETVNALIHIVATDESFIVRYAAIVSLGNIADPTALITLLPIISDGTAPPLDVSAAIVAIGEVVPKEGATIEMLKAVTRHAEDPEEFIRAAVARTLGAWKGVGDSLVVLVKMRDSENRDGGSVMVRTIIAEVLDEIAGI